MLATAIIDQNAVELKVVNFTINMHINYNVGTRNPKPAIYIFLISDTLSLQLFDSSSGGKLRSGNYSAW